MTKLFAGAADRNKGPILDVLKQVIDERDQENQNSALEIASGTGQHILHLARHFINWQWYPSDCDRKYLASIESYMEEADLPNLLKPMYIDVTTPTESWDNSSFRMENIDFIVNINMIHITPIICTEKLFEASGKLLKLGGKLITYGPYAVNGKLTPESNVNFDAHLRASNPTWGIRDVDMVKELAVKNNITLEKIVDMPANNKCLVFIKC